MTSALLPGGSTTQWRNTRAAILVRDRYRCQVPLPDGGVCGAYADTCGHIVPRCHGGDDSWTNLRAECGPHNYSHGGALASHPRPPPRHPTRW